MIVSQNFNSFIYIIQVYLLINKLKGANLILKKLNRINTDSTARPAPLGRLELYVRKSFFDRTKICT